MRRILAVYLAAYALVVAAATYTLWRSGLAAAIGPSRLVAVDIAAVMLAVLLAWTSRE